MTDVLQDSIDRLQSLRHVITRTNERKAIAEEVVDGFYFHGVYVGADLLRWIDVNTTGKFFISPRKLWFKDSKDAMLFTLWWTDD